MIDRAHLWWASCSPQSLLWSIWGELSYVLLDGLVLTDESLWTEVAQEQRIRISKALREELLVWSRNSVSTVLTARNILQLIAAEVSQYLQNSCYKCRKSSCVAVRYSSYA